jgi:two-component system OmpR family sensor kinase
MTESLGGVRRDRSPIDALIARVARTDRTRVALRRARTTRRLVLDLTVVLGVAGAGVAVLAGAGHSDSAPAVVLFVAGLSASGGSAAALMLMFAARLAGDARVVWIGLTVGWYCLLAIPVSIARDLEAEHEALAAAGTVLVDGVAVALWLLVLVAPSMPSAVVVLRTSVGTVAVLAAGAAGWALACPTLAMTVAESRSLGLAYALIWVVGALTVLARVADGRVPGLRTVGAGVAMLGAVQAGSFVVSTASAADSTPLLAELRLAAIAVVLWGSLRLVRRALVQLDDEQAAQEEELRCAVVRLAQTAGRDHDLRNGLAGLAGATAVLGKGAGTGHLSRVVAGELHRLDGMLAQPTGTDRGSARGAYAVAPALDGLVMLRRSSGMDVRADVEACLRAVGSPSTLAQVVTNLLANADRHAPGSPVRIAARRRDDRVEIRVRDFGPGVEPGRERAVLEPGIRDERAPGLGLGLHVCRTLLAAEDATIEILPADPCSPGCVVVLTLPRGERTGPERPRRPQRARDPSPASS